MNRHNRQISYFIVAIVFSVLSASCGGALYKVKPVTDLPPLSSTAKSASMGGVTVRVAPLLSDEESQELFEANLPLSGVLPIRVALNYESGVPLDLKKARFRLHDGAGREWKQLSSKQAVSRILSANGVYAYNPSSKKRFETEFGAYQLDLKTPLTDSERTRQGFLFFQTPGKLPLERPQGLVLQIENVPQPVQIAIN